MHIHIPDGMTREKILLRIRNNISRFQWNLRRQGMDDSMSTALEIYAEQCGTTVDHIKDVLIKQERPSDALLISVCCDEWKPDEPIYVPTKTDN